MLKRPLPSQGITKFLSLLKISYSGQALAFPENVDDVRLGVDRMELLDALVESYNRILCTGVEMKAAYPGDC